MNESKAITTTREEREDKIRRILEGLKELGCLPPESEVDIDSLFCLSLGLDNSVDEVQ